MSVRRQITDASSYRLLRRAVDCDAETFANAWERMPPPTENPRNPKTFLHRRQCTWGSEYAFGAQVSENAGPIATAPWLIQRCLEWVRDDISKNFVEIPPEDLTVAHVNWYSGGKAALSFHQDVEPTFKGRPVWSFTFIRASEGTSISRRFAIAADKQGKRIIDNLNLGHGDVLVMQGAFQSELWHSVPRSLRRDLENQERLNITIRPWGKINK